MTKGRKRVKGVGHLHDEVKRQISLTLTPTAQQRLDAMAAERGLSRSEFIEQIARGLIPLANAQVPTDGEILLLPSSELVEEEFSVVSSDLVEHQASSSEDEQFRLTQQDGEPKYPLDSTENQASIGDRKLSQPEQRDYKSEFPLDWKISHIIDSHLLPNRHGIYAVLYSDEEVKPEDFSTIRWKYDLYKPNKIFIQYSQDMQAQFQNDTVAKMHIKRLVELLTEVVPFAYIIWSEIYETSLISQIRESLIEFCKKAIYSQNLKILYNKKWEEREERIRSENSTDPNDFFDELNPGVRWD